MALKLLNPGLRPLGQFDLHDGVTLLGGEYVELQTFAPEPGGDEGHAADVGAMIAPAGTVVSFNIATRTAAAAVLGGLADEGTNEYGTLFGQVIGSTAGRGTMFLGAGVGGAAVTAGPASHVASGKVTVFDKEGLYGISGPGGSSAQLTTDAPAANDVLFSTVGTVGTNDPGGVSGQVGFYVAAVNDTSLVSTTDRHAAQGTRFEHHAIYYMGNAAA
jgi:hypothetical protein